jgi:hypothetical protein
MVSSSQTGVLVAETLTESFCERCGTRFSFEPPPKPKSSTKIRVFSRGLKAYVMHDGSGLRDVMQHTREDEDRRHTAAQIGRFHETFTFCLSCRQYTCSNCWNLLARTCLSCTPVPGSNLPEPQPTGVQPEAIPAAGGPIETAVTPEPELAQAEQALDPALPDPTPIAEPAPIVTAGPGAEPEPDPIVAAVLALEAALDAEAAADNDRTDQPRESAPHESAAPVAAATESAPPEREPDAARPVAVELGSEPLAAEPEPGIELGAADAPPSAETEPQVAAPPSAEPEPPVAGAPAWPSAEPESQVAAPPSAETEPPVAGAPAWPSAEPEPVRAAAAVEPESAEIPAPTPAGVGPAIPATSEDVGRAEPADRRGWETSRTPAPTPDLWWIVAPDPDAGPGKDAVSQPVWPTSPHGSQANLQSGATPSPIASNGSHRSVSPTDAVWAASSRDVLNRPGSGAQACNSCGLALSAAARFCRRCGAAQS